jgi:hypothetical protein
MPNDLTTRINNLVQLGTNLAEQNPQRLNRVQEDSTNVDYKKICQVLEYEIFEFVGRNKHDAKVQEFSIKLAQTLAQYL